MNILINVFRIKTEWEKEREYMIARRWYVDKWCFVLDYFTLYYLKNSEEIQTIPRLGSNHYSMWFCFFFLEFLLAVCWCTITFENWNRWLTDVAMVVVIELVAVAVAQQHPRWDGLVMNQSVYLGCTHEYLLLDN